MISRRVLKQPWLLLCNSCKMQWRVENITPYTIATRKFYCSSCGSSDVVEHASIENDRWYSMARSFGLSNGASSVDLLKQMFDFWDPQEHLLFRDFVKELVDEAKEQSKSGNKAKN